MGIFGKKKEEEFEEDDELIEDDNIDRKLTRKFKNLNPEGGTSAGKKEKKKEPPKPWGKKERLTVFLILVATVLISAGLTIYSNGFRLGSVVNLSIGSFNFDFDKYKILKEETIEIRKK